MWLDVTHSPLFGITLTLATYQAARTISRAARGHPLANPVLVAVALTVGVLAATHTSYDSYRVGGNYLTFLLGPATVALALPLHQHRRRIRQSAALVTVTVAAGSVASIATALAVTNWAGGTRALDLSLAPKSATTPVSIALAEATGGIPQLTACLTILTGVVGAVAGPHLLTWLRVRDERVRGLAVGTSSHGIGTAHLLHHEPPAAAFSALAMALNSLVTSLWLPVLIALLPLNR
jgi:predicted murein hydrolase (TIGR00659 family)